MSALSILAISIHLLVGLALVMTWNRRRQQRFTLTLGISYCLVALSSSVEFLDDPNLEFTFTGVIFVPILFTANVCLLISGIHSLIGQTLKKTHLFLFAISLFTCVQVVIGHGNQFLTQLLVSLAYLYIAVRACMGFRVQTPAERYVGVLLCLLALHPLISMTFSWHAAEMQMMVGALIRTALGFTVLYIALDRTLQEAVRLSQRFQMMIEHSQQGVLIATPEHALYANAEALKIYGARESAALDTRFRDITMPAAEQAMLLTEYQKVINGEREQFSWEGPRRRIDGSVRYLHFFAYPIEWDGIQAGCILITDETERLEQSRALLHRATHDSLTGLPNRSALMETLHAHCRSPDWAFALFMINIDRFKLFNAAHGYGVGDEILQAFSRVLATTVPIGGVLYRVGVDEFALFAQPLDHDPALLGLEQILLRQLAQPIDVSGGAFYVDASIGRADFPAHGEDADVIIRAANAAMHQSKNKPGSVITRAESRFEQGSTDMLTLEQALRIGIRQREVYLCYQPKVNSETGEIIGFEALARWNRPGIGMISPQEFIRAAETTGLIVELGSMLLLHACEQLATWIKTGHECVPVAVNVSPLQLLNPHFPSQVMDILKSTQVAPEFLTLEITESAAVENLEQTRVQLAQLQEMGIHVAMDDFGTGFSSLGMLRNLPLSTVKIDKALIDPLPSEEGKAVVQAICQLAAALGLKVVAEGVETEEQARAAREAGCDELQGYFYSKPLSTEDASRMLSGTQSDA
ncbi:EAL domain-containing protein [Burkholderiaceae bacterium DAT-1]|nr:EAL domain-containing protein [Burkholderiaceae bacterium DAT-1]